MNTQKRRKVVITVAPVGTNIASPSMNPLTPEDIAQDVIASAQAGASMVHLHVRDNQGNQTEDVTVFSHTLDLIRQESDIIIQGSTGGVTTLSREERCVSLNDPASRSRFLEYGLGECWRWECTSTHCPIFGFWAQTDAGTTYCPGVRNF